jgi:hypothetical protein
VLVNKWWYGHDARYVRHSEDTGTYNLLVISDVLTFLCSTNIHYRAHNIVHFFKAQFSTSLPSALTSPNWSFPSDTPNKTLHTSIYSPRVLQSSSISTPWTSPPKQFLLRSIQTSNSPIMQFSLFADALLALKTRYDYFPKHSGFKNHNSTLSR